MIFWVGQLRPLHRPGEFSLIELCRQPLCIILAPKTVLCSWLVSRKCFMRECKGAGASRGALETNTQCGVVLAIDADHKLVFASVQPRQALKVAVARGGVKMAGLGCSPQPSC